MGLKVGNAEDFLRMLAGEAEDRSKPRRRDGEYCVSILPEAALMRLKEEAQIYKKTRMLGPQFGPGDVVTPRAGHAIKGVGAPHFVVDINPHAKPNFSIDKDSSSNGTGVIQDMRVLCFIDDETVCAFWVESWMYEEYKA